MSFLKYRDKIFNRNKHENIKKRYVGQLKNAASCTDCRAWSNNPFIQRQYILESFSLPSVEPNEFSSKISTEYFRLFKKRSQIRRRKRALRRSLTDERLFELQIDSNRFEPTLDVRKLNDANENKQTNEETSVNVEDEVDNLRNLVKDLRDQVVYLEDFKKENSLLRTELNCNARKQLSLAEQEITYLSRKLDIYCDIEKRYEALLADNNVLKQQYNDLLKSVRELKREKENLIEELIQKKYELNESNSRALVVSNAIVDKKILKDKLLIKDDKIHFLLSIVENQEFSIHDMALEMQNLKANFSYKEEKLLQNMTQLKFELKQETTKSEKLENQLRVTEELVKELENLRDQFRITNSTLAEHIHTYKRQFNTIRSASENMVTVIKQLNIQLAEKDKQIKKLSIYPQSAISIVYFSHLDYVLNSIENLERPSEEMCKALSYMKHILKEIKNEIWKTEITPTCFHINNVANQTECTIIDKFTQYDRTICEQCVQTIIPHEYIIKYNEAQVLIKKLSASIKSLELSLCTKEQEINSLEAKLIYCIEEKAVKICQVEHLKQHNRSLKDQLYKRNKQIEYSDNLLINAMSELNSEKTLRDYNNSLFMNALDTTFSEYNSYISVLETFIDYNEQNVNVIYSFFVSDLNSDKENISEISEEINQLTQALDQDKLISQELFTKMNFLKNAIIQQNQYIDMIETKLSIAESTVEELQTTQTGSGYIASEEATLNIQQIDEEKCLVQTKISYNKNLQRILRHYKREKQQLKKKILQMQLNLRRINKFVYDLQKKLNLSEKIIDDLHAITDELTFENKALQEEKLNLIKDLEECNENMLNLKMNLETLEIKDREQEEDKLKMEEALIKLLKKLEKYKHQLFQSKKEIQKFNKKYLEQEERLDMEVSQLKRRNNENLKIIDNFKQQLINIQKIQMEEEEEAKSKLVPVSQSVQVNIEDKRLKEIHKNELHNMKEHYDSVIKILEKEYNIKNEKALHQHLNNLKSMKDTYERDMKFLKKTHNENVAKIQALHEEELATIKHEKESKISIDKGTAVNFYHPEIEKLKQNYVQLLNEKEDQFLKKLEEIKMHENERNSKEKEIEIKKIKTAMQKNVRKIKQKFRKHQRKVRELYEHKITNLHDKYKGLIDEEIKKITNNKTIMIDDYAQCDDNAFVWDDDDDNVPVKESALQKYSECPDSHLHGKGDASNINEIIVMNISPPKESAEFIIKKQIQDDILYKYKSFLANGMDFLPMPDIKGDEMFDSSSSVMTERGFMLNRINELEIELYLKNQEIKRNAALYDKKIKEEQMKNLEMGSLLDQEMNHSNDIQCRLGLEYNRSEQLQIEKEDLKNKCSQLEIRMLETEDMLENEKGRSSTLMNEIEKLSTQGGHADQLELSLLRLRHKLDQALDCEKRLTLELKKEIQHKKQIEALLRINDITEGQTNNSKSSSSKCDSDLKVIFIQQCGILHTWSKQISC